jgi:hypothetical protein
MGVLYIDRGFVSVNGVEVLDVESITLRVSDGTKYVPTMTRNRRYTGTVKGNRDININLAIAVQSTLGTPKLENIDYINNSVALTFEHGADRYTCVSLDFVDDEQSAPNVGAEGKKTFNFLAMDIIDQVGNSALFSTSLSSITANPTNT